MMASIATFPHLYVAIDWDKTQKRLPITLDRFASLAEQIEWKPNGVRVLDFDPSNQTAFFNFLEVLAHLGICFTAYSGEGE